MFAPCLLRVKTWAKLHQVVSPLLLINWAGSTRMLLSKRTFVLLDPVAHTFPLLPSFPPTPEHIIKCNRTKYINFSISKPQIKLIYMIVKISEYLKKKITFILWKEQFPKVQKYSTFTKAAHLNVTLNFWNLLHSYLSLLCFITSGQRTHLFNVYIKM